MCATCRRLLHCSGRSIVAASPNCGQYLLEGVLMEELWLKCTHEGPAHSSGASMRGTSTRTPPEVAAMREEERAGLATEVRAIEQFAHGPEPHAYRSRFLWRHNGFPIGSAVARVNLRLKGKAPGTWPPTESRCNPPIGSCSRPGLDASHFVPLLRIPGLPKPFAPSDSVTPSLAELPQGHATHHSQAVKWICEVIGYVSGGCPSLSLEAGPFVGVHECQAVT